MSRLDLFTELRRRNVFRVAAAYAVVAWLVLQVGDIAADNLGFPGWFMPMLFVLLGLGFPVALVLSWAFELTPGGVKKTKDVADDETVKPRAGRRIDRLIVVGLVAVIAVMAVERVWFAGRGAAGADPARTVASPAAADPAAVDKSIAVLPFADFSPDGDQAWFADGLAEEILNALARTPDLKVASRTASFAFRESSRPLAEIAGDLRVAHVLEGSVRRSGDQLRVTAQLIRAADGFHLWSENFDSSIDDAISIQERIALEIAQALKTAMDPDELARMVEAGTRSVEAWELWLRAQAMWEQGFRVLDRGSAPAAIAEAERAVAIDPAFARAHAWIAAFWLAQLDPADFMYGASALEASQVRDRFERHVQAAISAATDEASRLQYRAMLARSRVQLAHRIELLEQAATLRADQPEAWMSLGAALLEAGRFDDAAPVLSQAMERGRGTAREVAEVFQYLQRADPEAALPLIDRALADGGDNLDVLYQAHRALLHAGRMDRAAELARAFVLRDPDSESSLLVQTRQACAEGRVADAEALRERLPPDAPIRWLQLMTLGLEEEANTLLRPLETPATLFSLSVFLAYPFFDAGEFPLLNDTLLRQGIRRPPPRPIPFACRRSESRT